VPLLGLGELALHLHQVKSAVPEANWSRAREVVQSAAQKDDLVTFAPSWTDPLGRKAFGPLATVEREAYGDVSRFPRAFEVSIRGKRSADLLAWREVNRQTVDAITVRTLENPNYRPTLTDLVSRLNPTDAEVSVATPGSGMDQPCSYGHGSPQTGGLPSFGPTVPADLFSCPGTFAGVSVVTDLDYRAHRCIYAPPAGGSRTLRLEFHDVKFGEVLHGHHGLYVESERGKDGSPVHLAFSVDGNALAKVTHNDGDGWKGFDLPTAELNGKTADLTVEVTSPSSRRQYCFEAVTR